jgi:membrane protease YdiL (CAAX protease family)
VVGVRPLWALVWTGVAVGLFRSFAAAFSLLRAGSVDIVTLGAAQALAYVICLFSILRVHEREGVTRQGLGLRPTHPAFALMGIALGVSLKLPAESLTSVVERLFPTTEAQLLWRVSLYRTDTLAQVAGLLIVVCLVAPLVEELVFRGALYGRLARSSTAVAGALTGALFVITHPDVRHWPALLVVAAVLSYVRVVSGSLVPCLALHVAFNTVGVFALVTGAASPTRPLIVSMPALAASWLCTGVLLGAIVRFSNNADAVRARAEDRA